MQMEISSWLILLVLSVFNQKHLRNFIYPASTLLSNLLFFFATKGRHFGPVWPQTKLFSMRRTFSLLHTIMKYDTKQAHVNKSTGERSGLHCWTGLANTFVLAMSVF